MVKFEPEQLQEWSGGRWEGPPAEGVRGFSFDTRRIERGDLFVCLKSETRDGHDFIPQAAAAGAAGALVSRARGDVALSQLVVDDPLTALGQMATAHRRRFSGPVVGVTGSCGKTSTKDLLALLLGGAASVHATKGNFNNLIGAPITLLGLDPDRHQAAVIEAGINQGDEMEALSKMIQPTHGLVTIVAPAHLEFLGDLAGVAREKAKLLQAIPASGGAVFPADCLDFDEFRNLASRVCTVKRSVAAGPALDAASDSRPGRSGDEPAEQADVTYDVEQFPGRTVVHVKSDAGRQVFTLRKSSAGMAANAVLAIKMANLLNVSDSEIQARMLNWAPACFRGEVVEHGATRFYVDCYNANPAAMEDALELFAELSGDSANRMYVLGCMGELGVESGRYHRQLGSRIKLATGERILITGDEDVEALREGLLDAGNPPSQITVFHRIEEIEDQVCGFDGFVFIKGSRIYGLEKLLEHSAARAGGDMTC